MTPKLNLWKFIEKIQREHKHDSAPLTFKFKEKGQQWSQQTRHSVGLRHSASESSDINFRSLYKICQMASKMPDFSND